MTPVEGGALWGDGFFARFVFIAPPMTAVRQEGRFPEGERSIPATLIEPLREWDTQLNKSEVRVTERRGQEKKSTGHYDLDLIPSEPKYCTLGKGVFEAYYRYHDALCDLIQDSTNTDIDGNYARFAEKALRVAMLLASLGNNGHIELRHWARAQHIAERWRADLHHLVDQLLDSSQTTRQAVLEDRVLATLTRLGHATLRDFRRYHPDTSTEELAHLLDNLVRHNLIRQSETRNHTTRYHALEEDPKCRTVELSNRRDDPEVSTPPQEVRLLQGDEAVSPLSTVRQFDSSTVQPANNANNDDLEDDRLMLKIQDHVVVAAFEEAIQLAAQLQSISKQQQIVAKVEQYRATHEQTVAQINAGKQGPGLWKSNDRDFPVSILGLWNDHTVKVYTIDGSISGCPTCQTEFIEPESRYYEDALSISPNQDISDVHSRNASPHLPDNNQQHTTTSSPSSQTVEMLNDFFASIPPGCGLVLRLYLRSQRPEDQDRAHELCAEYGLDYEEARAVTCITGRDGLAFLVCRTRQQGGRLLSTRR